MNYVQIFLLLILTFALYICFREDVTISLETNNNSFETVCVDGVEYLSWAVGHRGYFAPHYKPNGDLYLCNEASNE